MSDFLNGIFRIWEKLPAESKTAFSENLTVKEKSAVKIGKQLLEYYVDVSQDYKRKEEERKIQEEEFLRQKKQGKKKKGQTTSSSSNQAETSYGNNATSSNPLDAFLKNIPPEVLQSVVVGMAQAFQQKENVIPPNSPQPTRAPQPQNTNSSEEDFIDVEWSEVAPSNKPNRK